MYLIRLPWLFSVDGESIESGRPGMREPDAVGQQGDVVWLPLSLKDEPRPEPPLAA
jgi:hypothetical protein